MVVKVNGTNINIQDRVEKGYLYLNRSWKANDIVELCFDMPVRKVFANKRVRADAGCVALMRGPIVYCFEGVDNGTDIQALRIPRE